MSGISSLSCCAHSLPEERKIAGRTSSARSRAKGRNTLQQVREQEQWNAWVINSTSSSLEPWGSARSLAVLAGSGIRRCHIFVMADNEPGRRFWERIGWRERTSLVIMSRDIGP